MVPLIEYLRQGRIQRDKILMCAKNTKNIAIRLAKVSNINNYYYQNQHGTEIESAQTMSAF